MLTRPWWHVLRKPEREASKSLEFSTTRNVGVVPGARKPSDGTVHQWTVKMESANLEPTLFTDLGIMVCVKLNFLIISRFISIIQWPLIIGYFPELSSRPIRVQPRRLCFPAISQVTMESGASISMSHLKVGDKVQTLGTNGESKFSEVITFLHKEIDAEAQFYNLKTKTGNSIKLSAHHLIFRKETNTSFISAVFASEIKMGDLLILNGSGPIFDTVTQITHMTMKGVYAPLTRQGTLFVDGVLVSCYAHWPSHDAAHLVMAPIRTADLLNRAWKKLTSLIVWLPEWLGKDSLKGVHWYPSILMSLTNTLII